MKGAEVERNSVEYIKLLLNKPFPRYEGQNINQQKGFSTHDLQAEVRQAIGKMKVGKAAGSDVLMGCEWRHRRC